ncbi:MAG: DUF5780 domain-containing protein [Oscillospiraceae bacterium]|nr:DUF5780 domain-containing protein [Oscillospiraceae bacterium]
MVKKKRTTLILALLMCLALCACGSNNSIEDNETPDTNISEERQTEEVAETDIVSENDVEDIVQQENPEDKFIMISIGDSIETDKFIMSFESFEIVPEFSINFSDRLSFTPSVDEGNQFAIIKGRFENTSSSTIDAYAFNLSFVANGEYTYDDVSLCFETNGYLEIDALEDLNFYIYLQIPDNLVEIYETGVLYMDFKSDLSTIVISTIIDDSGEIVVTTDTDNFYALACSPSASVETTATEAKEVLDADELLDAIANQDLKVISTNYLVQDEQHKALYPDMLQAVIQNNTEYDIKNAVVAFVAWDKNNLPVKIADSYDYDKSKASYIKEVNYSDINLVPDETFGEDAGYTVNEDCGIVTVKAIVVSYEAFTGEEWDNPYYDDWCELYEGIKLSE